MFQIKTFNAIASEGMNRFGKDKYAINESDQPDGVILRSHPSIIPVSFSQFILQ